MVRSALARKLKRDLWSNRMQFAAVILLCALGSWVFSGLDAAWRMFDLTSQTYFDNQHTAELWVTMADADRATLNRVKGISGVEDAQARATAELKVDLPHEPSLLAQAYEGAIRINTPLMRSGVELDGNDLRGCLLDDGFAQANGLRVGDQLPLKLNGGVADFIIRGTCLSAEFMSLSKGTVYDPLQYGFVLMNHKAIEALPLNGMVLTVHDGASVADVESALGGMYPEALLVNRSTQASTHGLQTDVQMFRNLSYVFPLLAFAVAAMIVLTTITRMLENQRMQMGILKALGYGDRQIRRHYLSYAFFPSLVGSLMGLFVGRATLPTVLWSMEAAQYVFPYRMQAPISAAQWTVCALGVVLSCSICLWTYQRSAREQTAELLRPKPPKAGRKLLLERCTRLWRKLSFNAKMVVRNLFRNKARTLMSLIGALCCTMLLITSLGLQDSVAFFVGKYYQGTLRYSVRADLKAEVGEAESYQKRIDAERVESVMERSVSARGGGTARTTALTVLEDGQRLMNLGQGESWCELPTSGALLTQKLAQVLNLTVGDRLELWLPGDDEPIQTTVADIAYVTIGQGVLMSRSVWDGFKKGSFTPTALLALNPTQRGMQRLNDLDELEELHYPTVQYEEMLQVLSSMTGVFSLMSGAALGLAFVVLYNMGILNFMERSREYATLKVLGYHQREIRRLMTNENALVTGLGVLLGILPGRWLIGVVLNSAESDSMVFVPTVKVVSVLIACVLTFVFGWMITRLLTRKVKKIDMVEALKSVE
ncbi:MAG: FtsX-like permease family protein [Clostridia bacterium]